MRRSRQIRERKSLFFFFFLLLLGGAFFSLPCAVFWGVKRQKTLSKKGCDKAKLCLKRGVKRQILCLKRGVKRQKSLSKILFSSQQISESIPFLFLCGKKGGVSRRLCADSGPWLERENEAISLGFSPGIFRGKAKAGEDYLNFSLYTCGIKSFFPAPSLSKVKFVNSHLPRRQCGTEISHQSLFFLAGKRAWVPKFLRKWGRGGFFLKKKMR